MTLKQFFTTALILLGLPVTVPLTLLLFWIKCSMNASDNLMNLLDDEHNTTEPNYVVEAIDDFNKRSRAKNAEDWHIKGKVKMNE